MTNTKENEAKREEIKARVAAAQAREEALAEPTATERAKAAASNAADGFTTFVKERPLTAAAGGLVLGIVVASMFKGPRRAAKAGGVKALSLATLGAELATAFASELAGDARDAGRAGARKAGDLADAAGDRARSLRRDASYQAARTGDLARIASRETGKRVARIFSRH